MSERGCNPNRVCDVIEEQDESDIIEIKAYCYNIPGKLEVCQPKTCTIRRRKEIGELDVEEPVDKSLAEEGHFKLVSEGAPEDTCVPWQATQQGDVGIEGRELQNYDGQLDNKKKSTSKGPNDQTDGNIIQENIQKQQNTNVSEKGKPANQRTSKDGMRSELSDENAKNVNQGQAKNINQDQGKNINQGQGKNIDQDQEKNINQGQAKNINQDQAKNMNQGQAGTNEKYQSSSEKVNQLNKASVASEEGSSPETIKEIVVAVDECQCCNCDPCECGPRGIVVENVIAALKTVQSSDQLAKLLKELSPEALSVIDEILMKEGVKAALWASGGATNIKGINEYIKGIEDDNFKEAVREAWMKGYFDEMTSCHCLPHLCPCPGGHTIYGMKEETDEQKKYRKKRGYGKRRQQWQTLKDEQKQKQMLKHKQSGAENEHLIIKRKLSDTCVCPPTKHYLTPATSGSVSSGDLTVRSRRMFWRDLMICSCPRLERTLAILKPDVVNFRDVVLRTIKKYGLDILNERRIQLTPEEASELYAKYYGRTQFPNMIVSISYAPIIAFSLGGINVVDHWKSIIGPNGVLPSEWFFADWIQRKHGLMSDMNETLHGSGNLLAAEKENRFFFPDSIIDPVMKNSEGVEEYMSKFVNPTLVKGLAIVTKSKPTDPITFLAEWLLFNNPFQPRFPAIVCLAPT
ncbi:hypothetical protein WA026_013177 [Henosepilachna vigintioctopunctata]|uniref:Nucleoside diphosphate kinase-like domain-containing protein n=1 Tax=Henosepilachna vigintioctopunctata TaxID=420089 RepID=A0AAW1UJY9_9CUCU